MRKIYLFLGFMIVLGACSKDDIKTYSSHNYLQFVKLVTDSSVCSFLAYPNDNELEFPVVVEVIGIPSGQEVEYKITVDEENTSATTANYRLPDKFSIKSGKASDTCKTHLLKPRKYDKSFESDVTIGAYGFIFNWDRPSAGKRSFMFLT